MRQTANHLLLAAILAVGVPGCGVNEPENISHWKVVADALEASGPNASAIRAYIETKTHMQVLSCEVVNGKPVVILAPPLEEWLTKGGGEIPTDFTPHGLVASLLLSAGLFSRIVSNRKKYRRSLEEANAKPIHIATPEEVEVKKKG